VTYLLDTCVLSESIARRPNEGVVNWLRATPIGASYLSAITIGEIKRGIARLPDEHQRRPQLNQWLDGEVLVQFRGRILALDSTVMLLWGETTGWLNREGRAIPLLDSLIAAQAIVNHLTLVTRNEKDFHGLNVRILNPWL
jgi:tRNA(fMet)-specific endonuclease VapC